MIDSHFDPEAENTPLQADEFEVDIGGQTINSIPAQNAKLPNSALNNCDDGFGGSSGGGTPTLPPVVATASYIFAPALYIVRTYNRAGSGTGNGGSTPMRAATKKEIKSQVDCGQERDVRAHAARVALDRTLGSWAASSTRSAIVTTSDGYDEFWVRASGSTPFVLSWSKCPSEGG